MGEPFFVNRRWTTQDGVVHARCEHATDKGRLVNVALVGPVPPGALVTLERDGLGGYRHVPQSEAA